MYKERTTAKEQHHRYNLIKFQYQISLFNLSFSY